MTLHLSCVSNLGLVHVSERLLTSGGSAFDARANKVLLFEAVDGLVVIGYSGLAALDGIYTDDWIAEKLQGMPLERGPRGNPTTRIGKHAAPTWPDIGHALNVLAAALEASVKRLPKSRRRIPQVIVYSGWQRTRKPYDARPIVGHIKHDGFGSIVTYSAKRYWNVPSRRGGFPFCLSAEPDGYVSPAELAQIGRTIHHGDPNQIEATLVNIIRDVARKQTTVGQSCMSIVIPRHSDVPSRIHYLPDRDEDVHLIGPSGSVKLAAVFTPWIVTPTFAQPPQVIGGSVRPAPILLDGRVLTFELPAASGPSSSPVIGYVGTQPRRRPR